MSVSAGLVSACQSGAFNHKARVLKLPSALAARQEFNQRALKQSGVQALACVSVEIKSAALRLKSELPAALHYYHPVTYLDCTERSSGVSGLPSGPEERSVK
jgi:hypothetical protein